MTTTMQVEYIDVNNLVFDPQNPRLPSSVNSNNEQDVISWMIVEASVVELLDSIAQQGFFSGEPLLGFRNEKEKIVVVEGNRRLAAVKLFNNPSLADRKKIQIRNIVEEAVQQAPSSIPVLVYPNRSDILMYLGYRHITGIKSWGALAKAKYLYQLQHNLVDLEPQAQFSRLAKEIGSNANYVARLLTSLKLYNVIEENDFFDIDGLSEKKLNFHFYLQQLHTQILLDL